MAGNIPNPQSPFVRAFNCKSCGAAITIRNARDSVVAVCQSCSAIIDLTDPNFKILSKARQKVNYEPFIPLGTRGKLHGLEWEVIGYLKRKDNESDYTWEEFLLFNPYHGYRWLTQAQGHWNYVVMTKEKPVSARSKLANKDQITFQEKTFRFFYRGHAEIIAVLGEFYWRAAIGETVEMEDYIHPPEMLSLEKDQSEQNWSLAEYIESEEIQRAFGLNKSLPQIGVAPNQPSRHQAHCQGIMRLWGVFSIVVVLLQIVHLFTSPGESAFRQTYPYRAYAGGIQQPVVTPPFKLRHGLSNVSLQLTAPVQNTWLEIGGDLVNEKSGESYSFDETVEYYSGNDGGEYWSEGQGRQQDLLSSIPDGTYHLDFTAKAAGPGETSRYVHIAPDMDYTLTIFRKVPTWSNFLWAFLWLSLLPLWAWWRKQSFELNRWSNSDFSPYSSGE